MRLSIEHERLVRMIKESITLMCKSSLSYDMELNVEGLLGITLDKKDIFLVNINESFQSDLPPKESADDSEEQMPPQQSQRDIIEIKEEDYEPSSCSKKRRVRRRSRNNSSGLVDTSASTITGDYELPAFSAESQSDRDKGSMSRTSAHASASQSRPDGTDMDRDNSRLSGAMDNTQSSGFAEDGDFGSFVIKQEVGEHGDSDVIGEVDFSSESFDSHSLTGPPGSSGHQSQAPYMSMEHTDPGSHSGYLASMGHPFDHSQHTSSTGVFKCCYCGKNFKSHQGLTSHMKLHTGKALQCEHCSRLFRTKYHLERHVRGVHETTRFECDECHSTFSLVERLRSHKKCHIQE